MKIETANMIQGILLFLPPEQDHQPVEYKINKH